MIEIHDRPETGQRGSDLWCEGTGTWQPAAQGLCELAARVLRPTGEAR